MNKDSITNSIVTIFQHFYQQQKDTLKVLHEQYVTNQSQNFQAFLQMLQQQNSTLAQTLTNSVTPQVMPGKETAEPVAFTNPAPVDTTPVAFTNPTPVDTTPVAFTNPTPVDTTPVAVPNPTPVDTTPVALTETPQVNRESAHIPQIANYLEPRHTVPTPQTEPVVSETPAAVVSDSAMSQALLEVVSDKTGYPTEMLELEMDLEADLGIDSIKRVEIMGTLQESFPNLPKLSPDELAEKRTLAQIVEYLERQMTVAEKKIA